jgi:hypothetical protein
VSLGQPAGTMSTETNPAYQPAVAWGGDEWNSAAHVPTSNLIILGEVDWRYSVTVKDSSKMRGMPLGQPWTGMAALNPFNVSGDPAPRADGGWGGWVYSVAVAYGLTMLAWPVKVVTAKLAILGVDSSTVQ